MSIPLYPQRGVIVMNELRINFFIKYVGVYLGSAQNDALSSSGTINVRLRYLATVTMSQI